jgi:WD40 repeat protein
MDAPEFRFGYLSAEAGCGKTSLIRAGLLPKLEARGCLVAYVPRSGPDPRSNVVRVLRQLLGVSLEGDAPLQQLVTAGLKVRPEARLIIICDQFEEFFVAQRTFSAREPFIMEVGSCVADPDLRVSFLFSVRKEFADDLQDFGRVVAQPMDKRFAERLRDWEPDTARNFLQAAAKHDQIPFSEALINAVVRDLTHGEEVRPVELQLAATRLKDDRVYELAPYVRGGRAEGVLATFIKEVVEPNGVSTAELRRQVTRHLLRALCADNRDAKRPKGLSFDQLVRYVSAGLSTAGQGQLLPSAQELEVVVAEVLHLCISNFLVILEDEHLYNLTNDYLVRPIRDATADVETVEEKANHLADQYLEDQRRHRGQILPWRHYRFLTRFLSPQRRREVAVNALLTRSLRRYSGVASLAVFLLLSLSALVLPHGVKVRLVTSVVNDGDWIISADRRLAVLRATDSTYTVWSVDDAWSTRKSLGVKLADLEISENSRYLLGRSRDGSIYLWQRDHGEYRRRRIPIQVEGGMSSSERWGGFSPASDRAYVVTDSGDIYLWRPAEALSSMNVWVHVGAWQVPYESPRRPKLRFNASGAWIAIMRAAIMKVDLIRSNPLEFYLFPTTQPPQRVVPTINFEVILHTPDRAAVFSEDGKWIATAGEDDIRVWKLGEQPDQKVRFDMSNDQDPLMQAEIFISPSGRYIVLRKAFGNFFMWSPDQPPSGTLRPLFVVPESPSEYGDANVVFSPDENWVAGKSRNGQLYLWETANPAKGTARPILVDHGYGTVRARFNPNSSLVVARSADGGIYAWRLGTKPDVAHPIARHDSQDTELLWSADNMHLYTFGGSDVYWGSWDQPLQQIIRSDSRVRALHVAPNRKELVIISERHVSRARRRWYLWGIPFTTLRWPALAPNHSPQDEE